MRIEFKFMPYPLRSYYEFDGVREPIRYNGMFYWIFKGQTYQQDSSFSEIYCNGKKIASCLLFYEWTVVDCCGRNWQMIEEKRHNDWRADWTATNGNRIMTFIRTQCCKGTAVIRSDWSENVGLLVGMVIPLCLSIG